MKAMITDIKRFAVHDGDGIRTTVFFKGCNLRCQWCHNPETLSGARQLALYQHKCTLCGTCAALCHAHQLENGVHTIDHQLCSHCGKCVESCPRDALKLFGTEMTSDEVLRILLEDQAFYETSGGGVTFSGGECMLQTDFLAELLPKCKQHGLRTAIDTAGNVPWASFERILPWADTFLYDVKVMDAQKHKRFTGADNALLLDNLTRLSQCGKTIYVRVPVVGGVNASEADIQSIADFLRPRAIAKVELLPYHDMYASKNQAVGRETAAFSIPTAAQMERFREIIAQT